MITSLSSMLTSGEHTIINARDPMQNLGKTRIFYKLFQTRLTRTKRDLDDPTQFQS